MIDQIMKMVQQQNRENPAVATHKLLDALINNLMDAGRTLAVLEQLGESLEPDAWKDETFRMAKELARDIDETRSKAMNLLRQVELNPHCYAPAMEGLFPNAGKDGPVLQPNQPEWAADMLAEDDKNQEGDKDGSS